MKGDHDNNLEMTSTESNARKRRTTPKCSRWKPTEEQISVLENLYKQGLRRPTAEHILEITATLRCFSNVKGKNVFYWFQNRKARQRIKQRQENHVKQSIHRCRHHPCVQCGCTNLHCVPQNDCIGRNPRTENVAENAKKSSSAHPHQTTITEHNLINMKTTQETLTLFPLHPTGMLQRENMEQETNFFELSTGESYWLRD